MDWERARRRTEDGSLEQALFGTVRYLGEVARGLNDLRVAGRAIPCAAGDPAVLAFTREQGARKFLLLANMSDRTVSVSVPDDYASARDVLGLADDDMARLAPYAVRWLVTE